MITVSQSNDGAPNPALKIKPASKPGISSRIFSVTSLSFFVLHLANTMKECILLVEDNDPNRETTVELLELLQYEVIVARDGKQGLDMFREKTPDLILTDIMMPVMDGYEFLEAIRKDHQPISAPFIFVTASSEKKDIERCMRMGASGYITKPFQGDELIRLIRNALRV
ncbi:MAG: response regulator [Bacteroidota bacterium]|nr:response regulator [Bacteroidota bacterium]